MAWNLNAVATTRTYHVGKWDNILKVELIVHPLKKQIEFKVYESPDSVIEPPFEVPLKYVMSDETELAMRRGLGPVGVDINHTDRVTEMANDWLDTLLMREYWKLDLRLYSADGTLIQHPFDKAPRKNVSEYDSDDYETSFAYSRWYEEFDKISVPFVIVELSSGTLSDGEAHSVISYVSEDTPFSYTAADKHFYGTMPKVYVGRQDDSTEIPAERWEGLSGRTVIGLEPFLVPSRRRASGFDARTAIILEP